MAFDCTSSCSLLFYYFYDFVKYLNKLQLHCNIINKIITTITRYFDKVINYLQSLRLMRYFNLQLHLVKREGFCLLELILNVPVNNFAVMSGQRHRFLGITSTYRGVNVPLLKNTTTAEVGIELPTSRSGIRDSTNRPPRYPGVGSD